MAIRSVRIGLPKKKNEGLRIGTTRYLPRGVRKKDYGKLNYFDLWLPQLAPSQKLIHSIKEGTINWSRFVERYKTEMSKPDNKRLIKLLALLSKKTNISIGCYCEDEKYCHRKILKQLIEKER